ncbi:MAG: hypothetical protein SFV15_24880 [Polyangiaceae bacterium]|nr:hypothetical protein [Polyangiaceae bacterium]
MNHSRVALAVGLFAMALGVRALAQEAPLAPQLPTDSGQISPSGEAAAASPSVLLWRKRYQQARDDIGAARYAEALRTLQAIQDSAPTPAERLLAHELGFIAQERLEHEERESAEPPDIRTADEMSVLYATSFLYGLGTSSWVTLQLKPKTVSAAFLPFAVLTTAAVGGVTVADGYRPLRRGVPQSIAAGLYLGLGEGIWVVGYQQAVAKRRPSVKRWQAERVSTVLWAGSTLFGFGGGVVGGLRQPTPGRVSYTSSTTVWGGILAGFGASALSTDRSRRAENSMLSAGVGYNLGLLGGLLTSPMVSPSVARVRLVDLGGIGGGLLGAGVYALADEKAQTPSLLGAMAISSGIGLLGTAWATSDMPKVLAPGTSAASASPQSTLQPAITPLKGGWLVGVSGEL